MKKGVTVLYASLIILIILFLGFLLSTCNINPLDWIITKIESIIDKNSTSSVSIDTEEVVSVSENNDDISNHHYIGTNPPYQFSFVDVFGNPYEVSISDVYPPTEYQKEYFYNSGQNLCYEDDDYYTRQGIDVSNHQGDIDWQAVKTSGIDFAIIRLGYRGYAEEGSVNVDKHFYQNIRDAQAAGIDVGVYFFAQAVSEEEAIEEARFVLNHLMGYSLQLPVVYDPENILNDIARTDNVSGEQFTKNTLAFCKIIEDAGYEPMIYSNMLWEAYQFDMEQLNMYPFWYADYEPLPQSPYAYRFLQYSDSGHVDGINGIVDLDIEFIKKNPE